MATYISNRDSGGLTDEKGHLKFLSNAFTGNVLDGQQVVENYPVGMSVRVSAGNIRIPYTNYAYMGWSEGYTGVSIATADPSNPRVDRIVAYVDRSLTFTDSDTNNPGALKYMAITGTPNAVPSKPSDSATQTAVGASNPWVELGLVTVGAGASDIQEEDIADTRTFVSPLYTADWRNVPANVTSVTNNGQRSYTLSVDEDLRSILTPGMRLMTERTVAAPTMSTYLNGTTQYYSKSSPSNMGMTDDITIIASVYIPKYPSSTATVISMLSTSNNGWAFAIDNDGTVRLYGYAGSGNWSGVVSYQSIPRGKWVYIAAQLDMSSFTATTTTSYIMIDGVDVPVRLSRAGTNPTALVVGGDLEVGSQAGGTFKFTGGIAQVAVFNGKVSQSTVLSYMSQGLTGSEPLLASAYSFNNSINDLKTGSANNLTAFGSATATNPVSPFGKQVDGTSDPLIDFSILTAVGPTSITVQVPEGCTIPTTGGVSSIKYSDSKSPSGFPMDKSRWSVDMLIYYAIAINTSGTTTSTTYNPGGLRIRLPVCNWDIVQNLSILFTPTSSNIGIVSGLGNANNGGDDPDLLEKTLLQLATTSNLQQISNSRSKNLNISSATDYYFLLRSDFAFSSLGYYGSTSTGGTRVQAYNGYL